MRIIFIKMKEFNHLFHEVLTMYVCICQGVTDTQIRQAVREGDTTFAQVRQHLKVANQCGRCSRMVKQIINEELANSASYYRVA